MTQVIALTPGEPAGIGPDLTVMLAQVARDYPLVAIADGELLQARAQQLGLPLGLQPWSPGATALPAGQLYLQHLPLAAPVTPGQLDPANAPYVLNTLAEAAQGCLTQRYQAIVTAPVHKGIINQAGVAFRGHTEFFADQAQVDKVVMMLACPQLRVALATTHLPLSQVPAAITAETLTQVITILAQDLRDKFRCAAPRILVCGLNPHAGEDGHLGDEELKIITPTLNTLRAQGLDLVGPVPADTAFTPHSLQGIDAVLAMYHDQGLPVLKTLGFGEAVNITLGLPFIRTSVDHGTALSLAGSGQAKSQSLQAALTLAAQLCSGSLNK